VLETAYYLLPTAYFVLDFGLQVFKETAYYLLPAAAGSGCRMPAISNFLLPTSNCLLLTAFCLLIPSAAYRISDLIPIVIQNAA